jgi:hypothetical protein
MTKKIIFSLVSLIAAISFAEPVVLTDKLEPLDERITAIENELNNYNAEEWTFTLDDGSQISKKICIITTSSQPLLGGWFAPPVSPTPDEPSEEPSADDEEESAEEEEEESIDEEEPLEDESEEEPEEEPVDEEPEENIDEGE